MSPGGATSMASVLSSLSLKMSITPTSTALTFLYFHVELAVTSWISSDCMYLSTFCEPSPVVGWLAGKLNIDGTKSGFSLSEAAAGAPRKGK